MDLRTIDLIRTLTSILILLFFLSCSEDNPNTTNSSSNDYLTPDANGNYSLSIDSFFYQTWNLDSGSCTQKANGLILYDSLDVSENNIQFIFNNVNIPTQSVIEILKNTDLAKETSSSESYLLQLKYKQDYIDNTVGVTQKYLYSKAEKVNNNQILITEKESDGTDFEYDNASFRFVCTYSY